MSYIFDVLKLSSNMEFLFHFRYSAEEKTDQKEYNSILLSFEALSFLSWGTLIAWRLGSKNAKLGLQLFSAESEKKIKIPSLMTISTPWHERDINIF